MDRVRSAKKLAEQKAQTVANSQFGKRKRKSSAAGQPLHPRKRNAFLAAAFFLIVADAVVAIVFTLTTPLDPRLDLAYFSRKQLRTVYLQASLAVLHVTTCGRAASGA